MNVPRPSTRARVWESSTDGRHEYADERFGEHDLAERQLRPNRAIFSGHRNDIPMPKTVHHTHVGTAENSDGNEAIAFEIGGNIISHARRPKTAMATTARTRTRYFLRSDMDYLDLGSLWC